MANERLYQFPSKASPTPSDIVFVGDAANAFDEVQCTIAEIIAAYPNLSGIGGLTLGANTYPYSNSSAVLTAGTITALGVSLLADSTVSAMQTTLGYTATPSVSLFAGWDVNKNLSANAFINGYTTIATAAGTTTLTVASTWQQFFTGATTQTVVLPVTSTLVLGQSFYIVNNSSGNVTVQSSGGNNIQVMGANTTLLVTVILTSGTTAASWYADYNFQTALTLPLSLANGGTNASLTASNGGILYSTASAMAILAGTATAQQLLMSGASTTPQWSTSTYPLTNAINTLLYASSANVMAALATVTSGVLTTVAGVPTWNTTGLPVTLGGTGTTSVTTVPAATAWAGWDANKNLSANSLIEGYATTATAAGTTTLTVASAYSQFFTGTLTQNCVMPVTSTLVLGQQYYIVNNSSGVVTVQSSGGNTIVAMAASTAALVTCILTSGTTAASWYAEYEQASLILPLSMANGGTGASLVGANNSLVYTSSTTTMALLATANSSVLGTDGSGNLAWLTTLPSGLAATNMTLTTPILGTPQSGTLTNCTGYTVAHLTDVGWTDFSGTIGYTGFSGTPTTNLARFKIIGKTCFFAISMTGTSNATSFTITGMPASFGSSAEGGLVSATNNGSTVYTANWANASATTISMLLNNNSSGWTNTGTKGVVMQGFYETT